MSTNLKWNDKTDRRGRNRREHAKYNREWNKNHPAHAKDTDLRKKYGLSVEAVQRLFESQAGVCKICGKPETYIRYGKVAALCIDHDHNCCSGQKSCGKCIRGMLCRNCNVSLGLMRNSPEQLRAAADYIESYNVKH